MEPVTNPDDSPFKNLDVWCDWNGNVADPVSITISIEVWGRPNLKLPILSTQSPNVVKDPTRIVRLKPDCVSCNTGTPLEPESGASSGFDGGATEIYTPTNRVDASICAMGNGSREDGPLVSRKDSPICTPCIGRLCAMGNGSREDGPLASRKDSPICTPCIGRLYATAQNDASDSSHCASRPSMIISLIPEPRNSESQHSPNPRKRSAKTASLPDSISPDDGCNVTLSKPLTPNTRPSKPWSKNSRSHRKKGSFIPVSIRRTASLAGSSATSENAAFVRSSTPSPEAVFPGIKSASLPADFKSTTVESVPDEGTPPWHDPETPPNEIGLGINEPLSKANLDQWSCDRLSTRACEGSFSNTEESDDETDDLLNSLESIKAFSRSGSEDSCHHCPRAQISLADLVGRNEPTLVMDNRVLYLQTSPTVYPATYEIGLSLKVHLQKGISKDWWELIIGGLPRLTDFESGYLYFRTPPGQGMEFLTSSFKRHTMIESCLMAQFESGKGLVVPLRKCSAEDFGYLKDYKVNAVIKSKIEGTQDPLPWLVKYNAVCSIDLINRCFWAKKCKFHLYVHGGPEGEFDAVLDAERPPFNNIRLELAPGGRIGVSKIHVTSTREALDMFKVCWDIKLPREKALTWLPWIKGTYKSSDAEDSLRREYESLDPMDGHDFLDPPSRRAPCPEHEILCCCEDKDVKATVAEPEALEFSPCPDLPDYEEYHSVNGTPSLFSPLATEPQDPMPSFLADESPSICDPLAMDSREPILSDKAFHRRGTISGNLSSVYPNTKPAFARPAVCSESSSSPWQLLGTKETPHSPNLYAPGQVPEIRVSEIQDQETEAPETQLPEPQLLTSTVGEMLIAKSRPRPAESVLSSLVSLVNILFNVLTWAMSAYVIYMYWSNRMWRDFTTTLNPPCPHHQAAAFHSNLMGHEEGPHYAESVKGAETGLPELQFQPMPHPSEFEYPGLKQSANTVPASGTSMTLRDRFDYLLGWRGPIARE
ncbi:uncharacterized protein N7515_003657 [Penicillium bovifimosum]|uniref:Uncharacterized protein n=1 Tax=Penicillium bovifimosum TaxID=126998 RepID=A0A9W9L5Y2_9EURO|nr:uncharacterized protein N7515_003657 [Penicillium bovifimosum]KAJ5138809.1 hypothetical protein N7515_003657 [Penicillium bovifimosum]